MKEKLEIAVNIVFIALAILVGGILTKNLILPNNASSNIDLAPGIGFQMPDIPSYKWGDHEHTLVLALKKGCSYCENSLPFYRKLTQLKKENKIPTNIISIFPESDDVAKEVLTSKNLAVDAFGDAKLSLFKISGTPTLVLVDKHGYVKNSWVGQLTKDKEDEVVRILSGNSK